MLKEKIALVTAFIRQYLCYIRKIPGYFQDQTVLLLMALVFSSIGLIIPIIIKYLIDTVMATKNYNMIFNYFVAMVLLSILSHFGSTWQGLVKLRHTQKVTLRLQNFFLKKVLRRNLLFHINLPPGQVLSRSQSDIKTFAEFLSSQLNSLLVLVLQFLIMFCILLFQNRNLTLLTIINIPIYAIILWRFHPIRKRLSTEITQQSSEVTGVIQEMFANIKLIKVYALELYALHKINQKVRQTIDLTFKNFRVNFWFGLIMLFSLSLGPLLVLYFGIQSVKSGLITIGSLYLFITYMGRLLAPVEGMKNFAGSGLRAKVALDRIEEYIQPEALATKPNAKPQGGSRRLGQIENISAENLSYAYPGREPLFSGVKLELEKGQTYILTGENGSGKSTLISLLMGLFPPTRGVIQINRINMECFQGKVLHKKFVLVPQEGFFINDSILENLTLGNSQLTKAKIMELCESMGIHETIAKIPKQYDARLGDNGLKLSGGERQRLALVRALLYKPEVLILDEALSEIDENSGLAIFNFIRARMAGKILLLISHQHSAGNTVDKWLHLSNQGLQIMDKNL